MLWESPHGGAQPRWNAALGMNLYLLVMVCAGQAALSHVVPCVENDLDNVKIILGLETALFSLTVLVF